MPPMASTAQWQATITRSSRYSVETDTYIYEADLVLPNAKAEQPAVTVNGPIKFAIVKSDLYLQDEQGKQFKLVLAKKTLKENTPNRHLPKAVFHRRMAEHKIENRFQ